MAIDIKLVASTHRPVPGITRNIDLTGAVDRVITLASSPRSIGVYAAPILGMPPIYTLSGHLKGNGEIKIDAPGRYEFENLCTGQDQFYVRVGPASETGRRVGLPPGNSSVLVDDIGCRFVGGPLVGSSVKYPGRTTVPLWMTACTVAPCLLADGAIHQAEDYPALAALFNPGGSAFRVPDLRARMRAEGSLIMIAT